MTDDVTPASPVAADAPVEVTAQKPKRKRRTKAEMEAARAAEAVARAAAVAAGEPGPPKRRRGRPRKGEQAAAPEGEAPAASPETPAPAPEVAEAPKRRRGRPRKGEQAAGDEMTKMTQEATQADSEPTPMPAQTLSAEGSAQAPPLLRPRRRATGPPGSGAQAGRPGPSSQPSSGLRCRALTHA